jgi:hypothetical protein
MLESNYKEYENVKEFKTDGKCYCPYSIQEFEIKDLKHVVCGGLVDITKLNIKKLKGGKK